MRKTSFPISSVIALSIGFQCHGAAGIDARKYLEHVKYLSSDKLKGRGTGTPGLEKAANYLAKQFHEMKLEPLHGKSYFQNFDVTTNAHIGAKNSFEFSTTGQKTSLKLRQDFIPFNFSASSTIAGPVVFAGYGITAPEYNYDDYAGVDVKDKLVLLLRHEPQEFDEKSVFAGKTYTEHSQFSSKATNAKLHGARGVIFINDVMAHPSDPDQLEKFVRTVGPGNPGIPFVQIKEEIAEGWFHTAGKNLKEIAADIDKDLQPRSFALPDRLRVRISIDLKREVKTVHNVGAYLPGETPEYIILGAHYDHLGLGEQFSLAPSLAGTAHPGADDNASGTSGVVELAEWFSSQPQHKRGILFLLFAGEELGLLGSSYYVNHPELPLDKAVAMINMDMIGRIREGKIYIGGVGTGSTFKSILSDAGSHYSFKSDVSEQAGYGSSDHTSFTTRQVPVLFFFSGLHGDYHKPTDTWDKIDAAGAVKLLAMIAEVTGKLAAADSKPAYVRVADPHPSHAGSPSGSTTSGYGPYFGSIPDFSEPPRGVRFADVRDNSPAAKAGLRQGDILIDFDGKPIQNLYDFTYALRQKRPGDLVIVRVLRSDQTIEAKVLLAERK